MFNFPLLQAQAAGGSNLMMMVTIGLLFLIMYFFIMRPQQKKQKETEKMISALKKGDKIITIGGIHGVVSSTRDLTVIVKVDDDAKIEFSRSAIATVVVDKPAATKAESKKEKSSDPIEKK
ncbi:MAG: preprotein translocase subunit YajC [Treponemataceae bacterium]